jgi:hypothetical protein
VALTEGDLEVAKTNADMVEKFKTFAVGKTNPEDWVNFHGNPYPMDAAKMSIAGTFGVSFPAEAQSVKKVDEYTDELGPVRIYGATAEAIWRGVRVADTGQSSTADRFFNRTDENGKYVRIPLSQVDIPSVMKKAVTNACGRAAKRLLILSFTWDEVTAIFKAVGKDPSKCKGVSFSKGKRGGHGKGPESADAVQVRAELSAALLEMANDDPDEAVALLEKFTDWMSRGPVSQVEKLSAKQAAAVLKNIREARKPGEGAEPKGQEEMFK